MQLGVGSETNNAFSDKRVSGVAYLTSADEESSSSPSGLPFCPYLKSIPIHPCMNFCLFLHKNLFFYIFLHIHFLKHLTSDYLFTISLKYKFFLFFKIILVCVCSTLAYNVNFIVENHYSLALVKEKPLDSNLFFIW